MAKQGMKRPQRTHTQPRNDTTSVPEIQGKSKCGKKHAKPIIAGTQSPNQKVFHTVPFSLQKSIEKPIPSVYPAIDNDLARDNLENDIPNADLQDL